MKEATVSFFSEILKKVGKVAISLLTYWCETEINMHIAVKTPKQLRHEKGLYTIVEVARKIGVSREVIDYHVKHGRCVAPTVQINGLPRRYYTADDVVSLAQHFARGRRNLGQPTKAEKRKRNENERN